MRNPDVGVLFCLFLLIWDLCCPSCGFPSSLFWALKHRQIPNHSHIFNQAHAETARPEHPSLSSCHKNATAKNIWKNVPPLDVLEKLEHWIMVWMSECFKVQICCKRLKGKHFDLKAAILVTTLADLSRLQFNNQFKISDNILILINLRTFAIWFDAKAEITL